MGLFDEIKREFIARPDESKGQIIYKWPDKNIRKFTQVVVEADEKAVFFKDGKVVGTLEPGKYRIDGSAIPFLNLIIDAATGGNFMISELYFVSTREFPDLPFGGSIDNILDPISKLAVGLRVFGTYSMKVVDPSSLIVKLIGTQKLETNDQITVWVKEQLMKELKDTITERVTKGELPVLGIAAQTEELEKVIISGAEEHLRDYGIQIGKLGNFTISLKEEDEAMLKNLMRDKVYTSQPGLAETAVKIGLAEGLKQGGEGTGAASAGVGAGVGIGMGMAMMKEMMQNKQTVRVCAKCGHTIDPEAKFCQNCGEILTIDTRKKHP